MKVTREDWQAAVEQLQAEARERLGGPPTWEEWERYQAGGMSRKEARRMRELLVAYPDLTRVLVSDFDLVPPAPGEPGYMTDAEVEERWQQLMHRVYYKHERPRGRSLAGVRNPLPRRVPLGPATLRLGGLA